MEIKELIKSEIISELKKTLKNKSVFQRKMMEKIIKTIGKMNIHIVCEGEIVTANIKTEYFNNSVSKKIKDLSPEMEIFPEKKEFSVTIESNEIL